MLTIVNLFYLIYYQFKQQYFNIVLLHLYALKTLDFMIWLNIVSTVLEKILFHLKIITHCSELLKKLSLHRDIIFIFCHFDFIFII